MTQPISVIKRSADGSEVIRYTGKLLHRDEHAIVLEAIFERQAVKVADTVFRAGDRFVETYFTDRWYNIFEVHAREDDHLKGWYCNIGKPALMESESVISYVDLALDLWVAPDGTHTILDKTEFTALKLDQDTSSRALAGLAELIMLFEHGNVQALPGTQPSE
jgi:protein associated with RNAse G/E